MNATPKPARSGEPGRCEVYPRAMLRTPIRSYRRFLEMSASGDSTSSLLAAYRDPVIRRALRAKSRSLFAALERSERGSAPLDDDARAALYRYFVRITTRCTPLMLFAGVGSALVGDFVQVTQAHQADWRLGIFPSWNSILRLTRELLHNDAVRHAARFRFIEAVVSRGGVLCYFTEQEPEGSQILTPRYKVVSLRQDPQLRPLAADPARQWSWAELVAIIRTAQPDATQEMADAYIFSMIDGGVLICNLQPPSIGPRPERHLHTLATRDLDLAALLAPSRDLLAITDQPLPIADPGFDASWEALEQHPWVASVDREAGASSAALRHGTISQAVLRIDARAGGISRDLIAQLGDLVVRTPSLWTHRFARHRQAIAEHFGAGTIGRRIPLLELAFAVLRGATLSEMISAPLTQPQTPRDTPPPPHKGYLASKLFDADLHQIEQIDLDIEALVQKLPAAGAAQHPSPPPICEAMVRVVNLKGKLALQHYNICASAGGLLNRFLHWNADDPILRQLQEIWRLEEALARPAIMAEVTCGGGGRLRDLSQRPLTYLHQIVVNGQPSVAKEFQIPLQELSVFIGAQGPVLWWEREGVQVIARQLSALHPQALSPIVHLLLALDASPTDWVLREDEIGLPVRTARICHRDIILQPQSWLLPPSLRTLLMQPVKDRDGSEATALLRKWRERYQVPRFVRPGDAERNAVDLDNPLALHDLRDMLEAGPQRVLEEYLEADSPAIGDDGPLVAEAVVHLRLHAARALESPRQVEPATHALADLETAEMRSAHVFHPGSPWLYLKLYYGTGLGSHADTRKFIDDDLLGRFVSPLIRDLEKSGRITNFHFVRYADPEAHLRIRLQPKEGGGLALLEALRPQLDAQVRAGAFARWVVDTYAREVDRYGGPEVIAAAEQLFTADSRLCLRMLAAFFADRLEPEIELQMLLPIRTLNTLYRCFDIDLPARKDCFMNLRRALDHAPPRSASMKAALDTKYRQHSRAIQSLILSLDGHAASEVPFARRKDVTAWFAAYERSVREVAAI